MIIEEQGASYSGDPGTSKRDTMRFLIGDTDVSDAVLTDVEIDFVLGQYQNKGKSDYFVAALIADVAAARMARTINRTAGTMELGYNAAENPYIERAKTLRQLDLDLEDDLAGPVPAGGEAAVLWASGREPFFWVGQFDNPQTGPGQTPHGV